MQKRFLEWFQAPVFPGEEDKTRRALLLNIVLNVLIIALPVLFIGTFFGGNRHTIVMGIIVLIWAGIFGLRHVMNTGQVPAAGTALVILIYIGTTFALYSIGTIRAPATSFYFLTVMMAGLTINQRAIYWMAGLSGVTAIALVLAEINGLLPQPTLTITITQGIIFAIVFSTINILLAVGVKKIDEALAAARQEIAERIRAKEQEKKRREMMEKVIQIGKVVTEQTTELRTALFKIWESTRNQLGFDRVAIFLYDKRDHTLQGTFGTDRTGKMSEEWDMKFVPREDGFLTVALNQPNGFFHAQNYEDEVPDSSRPGHPMQGVKQYAVAACWNGDKPVAVICVDQLISGRIITEEQLEALRLFAGYAGLAIENARLNTELKERMQEREQFIQELGNRNAELERFTYTVSHDLRSPLVTIQGFVGMLNQDIQDAKKDYIARDMQRISNAAQKMDSLLKDLLELSRIGRIINPPESIDLVQLTHDTLETLNGRLHAKNITTHVSPDLPMIYGDLTRIGEVLGNLIDNAAKYMSDRPDPLIEVGTRDNNGEQIIYVKDNGIGIEPQHLQKIFGLFDKLDPTSEGTGIGLALIKRIVEVHGGRIWAESEGLGKGSTFCFIIPDGRETA